VKSYQVKYSPKAESDLREAWRHIALDNMVAADQFFDAVGKNVNLLIEFPERGVLRPELRPNLRMLVEGKYLIFYSVFGKTIRVVRILHGSQDRTKIFT
jgi:toxin ParE1/3/4